ncbi:MAG: ComF family protein [Ectothiorhodospiraceae bacterium]|nr:ComF family protein [Ectothiorhodospiraceae bacterium]
MLLPPVCTLCGDVGEPNTKYARDLCRPCRLSLPWNETACARCAIPLSRFVVNGGFIEALCGQCQIQPPSYEQCLSPFLYYRPVDKLLQGLKFNGRLAQARLMGELMGQWLASVVEVMPDQLIPVPLHPTRIRERGFNQATELARPIAKRLNIPLNLSVVQRRVATPPQSDLTRQERLKNIRNVFNVVKPVDGHVVIIDDVMTTGSTVEELAKTLLRAGAEQVDVWVCARA